MNSLFPLPFSESKLGLIPSQAHVVELVDTGDLKSLGKCAVPVRVRPWAP